MYTQELKIPKERVGVLIGKDGEVKKRIEHKADVSLDINSETGDVAISGEDSISVFDTRIVVQAIGRGFSPEIAIQLFNEECIMEVIEIKEYTGKSKKKMDRLRGRVIGEQGKSRKAIEHLTETAVSIYGKTICIVGGAERVSLARRAIEMLLGGSPHGPVYKMLERKQRELHRRELEHGQA